MKRIFHIKNLHIGHVAKSYKIMFLYIFDINLNRIEFKFFKIIKNSKLY